MAKGDALTKSKNKTPDRCVVKAGCTNGSTYDGKYLSKGTIVQSKDFDGKPWYLVVLDDHGPPGNWYQPDCLDVRQGKIQPHEPAKKAKCVVRKVAERYEATFDLTQAEVDSYIVAGFEVILEDTKNPS